MRVKKKSRRRTKRIVQFSLFFTAVALLAVLLTSLDSKDMSVDAASLKHIDEIVASSGTFNILEIVPDTAGASVGYYIDGQEPIAGWKSSLSALTSPADRSDYVNTLFGRLANRGVLSGGETTPLRHTYYDTQNSSYYTETYEPAVLEEWNTLELAVAESTAKTGTFTEADEGPFEANYTYSPLADGGYVQNIYYFSYTDTPDAGSGAYYYDPVFSPITPDTDLDAISGSPVYRLDENGHYAINPDAVTVADIIAAGGFELTDPDVPEYFYIDSAQTGAPGAFNYEAIPASDNEFIEASDSAPSYFTREIDSFTYVGTGGHYVYSSEGSEEWTVYYENVYYKAGFANNNLFKKLVFDLGNGEPGRDLSALNVTVTVRAASAVSTSDVSAADLIYLSSGTDLTYGGVTTAYTDSNDISDTVAADVYNFAANRYPVIVDYSIINGINQWTPPSEVNRMEKLCLLVLQSSLDETDETSLSALDYDWDLLLYMFNDVDRTFVSNNIYCFNPFNTASTGNPPDISTLVTSLFSTPFSSQVYNDGFSDVLAEIQNENFLREIAGETDMLPENVTVASSARHIINFRGRRESNPKTHITVLDLQPAKVTQSTWLTPEEVSDWIDGSLDADKITVVHMTTGEFNGKIEDINETYDMIYIGMSTETLNTLHGSTVYNDASMNGLIYSNIGDTYRATIEMAGIREQDYVWVDGVKAINGTEGTNANLFRFSGNDITKTKVSELRKFAQAGYPIILSDGFVAGGGIDGSHVDSSSYMYEAVAAVYGSFGNVMTESYADNWNNADEVIQYLNVSKPVLDIISKPVDYEVTSGATLTADDDGFCYLDFVFSIGNVTDPTPISTTYDCRLYIDLNADGRYDASEELGDINVRRASDGTLVLPLTNGGGETYALSADIDYHVTRQMPEEYVGIIPWKIEVIKNGAVQIHASAEGFTRIAAGVHKETVSVLQIMQSGTYNSKLNLHEQLASGGIYGQLISSLEDFDIHIEAIENDDLEGKGEAADIFDYLDGYDMLIIGFNDCYDGIGAQSAEAIVNYIGTGKSVLFTHDTTSLSQVPYYNYPMATQGDPPDRKDLNDTDIVWDQTTSRYASINGNVNWYGSYSTTPPPYLEQNNPTYVVFLDEAPQEWWDENDYYEAKAGSDRDFEIYYINSISNSYSSVRWAKQTNVRQWTSLASFESMYYGTIVYVYCGAGDVSGWHRNNPYNRYSISANCDFTKFEGGTRYNCTDLRFSIASGSNHGYPTADSNDYDWIAFCLANDRYPDYYEVVGSYDGTYYWINGTRYWPADGVSFPASVLYDGDPSDEFELDVIPNRISDWGYYFNTVIRDAVGLDRYGVTSTMSTASGLMLKDIVDTSESMTYGDIDTVLASNRSVAFAPKSGRSATVDEFQGYTNYALIRFAESNNYRYTNNTYNTRETTNVSQVNKGQITTYPYNVNTQNFSANSSFIGNGGSYMTIGLTHEQYFQINMNTDDIVVWYCLSSGGYDNNSYYDDVPNDCVNSYYIYNKGNVTYSGVGHSSNAGLYGSNPGQEYVNEAKLFVNTMIAAYQSGEQRPEVRIKQDERGTADLSEKFLPVDIGTTESTVLQTELDPMDDERIIYYRIYDPNMGQDKTITVSYYVGEADGSIDDAERLELTTYYVDGTETETLKGGYVYKIYLPNDCLNRLKDDNVYSIRVYVQITTTIGGEPMTPVYDSIELKKQQLFELS